MATKLESLFEMYSADLKKFRPDLEGYFVCPLCLCAFTRSPILSDIVAEEHIVPQALGGRLVTLTCRSCNNSAGSDLEAHLVQQVRVDARKLPLGLQMKMAGAQLRGEFHLPAGSNKECRIDIIGKQSDPRQVAEAQRQLKQGRRIDEITLRLDSGFNPTRSKAALIRSAYLLMFRTFGYPYVFDVSAQEIRAQITEPLHETYVLKGIPWRVDATVTLETALAVVRAPAQFRSFVALLRLDENPIHVAAVTLPPPGVAGPEFYEALAQSGPQRTCRLLPVPNGFFPFQELWDRLASAEAT